jgi:RNA polymerase sigma factor (sigma-70 family)
VKIGPHPDTLVDDLRRGERDAFVRFYELYRLPVYNLVLTLTHAADETPSLVRDVFVTAYRQMLLSSGTVLLSPWTYRVAVGTAEGYLRNGAQESSDATVTDEASPEQWDHGDLPARFAEALDELTVRQRAALVLTDVYGLRHDDLAIVFGVSRDAVRSLLFRARESFRQAFDEASARHAAPGCRLAEQAAAASVGRALGPDEERKVRQHAAYCRVCQPIVKAWPAGLTGLALFLGEAPLPDALAAAPVFATPVPLPVAAETRKAAAAAGLLIPFDQALRHAGRALASKAAAYAVAAVCLAAAIGMVVYVGELGDVSRSPAPLASAARQIPHGERGLGPVVTPSTNRKAGSSSQQAATVVEVAAREGAPASGVSELGIAGWASGGELSGDVAGVDGGGQAVPGGSTTPTDTPTPPTATPTPTEAPTPPPDTTPTTGPGKSGTASGPKSSRANGRAHAGGNGRAHAGGNGKAHAGGNGKTHAGGNGKTHAGGNGKTHADGNGKTHADGNGKAATRKTTTAGKASTRSKADRQVRTVKTSSAKRATSHGRSATAKAKAIKPKTHKQTRKPSKTQQ